MLDGAAIGSEFRLPELWVGWVPVIALGGANNTVIGTQEIVTWVEGHDQAVKVGEAKASVSAMAEPSLARIRAGTRRCQEADLSVAYLAGGIFARKSMSSSLW